MYWVLPTAPIIGRPVAERHLPLMLSPEWQPQLFTKASREKMPRRILRKSSWWIHDFEALSIVFE